jgi:hypothetical protein
MFAKMVRIIIESEGMKDKRKHWRLMAAVRFKDMKQGSFLQFSALIHFQTQLSGLLRLDTDDLLLGSLLII